MLRASLVHKDHHVDHHETNKIKSVINIIMNMKYYIIVKNASALFKAMASSECAFLVPMVFNCFDNASRALPV